MVNIVVPFSIGSREWARGRSLAAIGYGARQYRAAPVTYAETLQAAREGVDYLRVWLQRERSEHGRRSARRLLVAAQSNLRRLESYARINAMMEAA